MMVSTHVLMVFFDQEVFMRFVLFCCVLSLTWSSIFACQIGDYDGCLSKAKKGDDKAQTGLGLMYVKGRGVSKDPKAAAKWFRLAAEQGNAFAQSELGVLYMDGKGVAQSDEEAVKWYRLSAEQGYAGGQALLAGMYAQGRGVPQNKEEAMKWKKLAMAQGNKRLHSVVGLFGFILIFFASYPLNKVIRNKLYSCIILIAIGGGIAYFMKSWIFMSAVGLGTVLGLLMTPKIPQNSETALVESNE